MNPCSLLRSKLTAGGHGLPLLLGALVPHPKLLISLSDWFLRSYPVASRQLHAVMAGGDGGLPGLEQLVGVFPLPLPHWNLYPTVVLTLTPSSSQVPSSARSPPAQLWRAGEEGCADSPRCSSPWWRPMLRPSQPVSGLLLPLRTFCSARLCVCVQEFAFPSGPSSIQELAWERNFCSQGCGKP